MRTIELCLYPDRRTRIIRCLEMIKDSERIIFTFTKPGWQYDEWIHEIDPNEAPYEIATVLLGSRYSLSHLSSLGMMPEPLYYRSLHCLFIEHLLYTTPLNKNLILRVTGDVTVENMQRVTVDRIDARVDYVRR